MSKHGIIMLAAGDMCFICVSKASTTSVVILTASYESIIVVALTVTVIVTVALNFGSHHMAI
jgi:hypothetical protein